MTVVKSTKEGVYQHIYKAVTVSDLVRPVFEGAKTPPVDFGGRDVYEPRGAGKSSSGGSAYGARGYNRQESRRESEKKSDGKTGDDKKVEKRQRAEEDKKSSGGLMSESRLLQAEKLEITRLQSAEAAVIAHERAHMAVAGGLARGGAAYEYQVGPDGKRYAVSGEVTIDTSPEHDPKATTKKMQRVLAAALAPVVPSAADRAVAAQASRVIAAATAELQSLAGAQNAQEKQQIVSKSLAGGEKAGNTGSGATVSTRIDLIV